MIDEICIQQEGTQNALYTPTPKEENILDILLNPEHRMKSITDICKLANCSRNIYYEAFSKPNFRALYEEKVKDLVKQSVGPVLNTFVKEALRGSFPHGKVILEMAGIYTERQRTEISGDVVISALAPEERKTRIQELLAQKAKILAQKIED